MIKSFQHKGLEAFFQSGSKAGIQPAHVNRLRVQLAKLDAAKDQEDMRCLDGNCTLYQVTMLDIGRCGSMAIGG